MWTLQTERMHDKRELYKMKLNVETLVGAVYDMTFLFQSLLE